MGPGRDNILLAKTEKAEDGASGSRLVVDAKFKVPIEQVEVLSVWWAV